MASELETRAAETGTWDRHRQGQAVSEVGALVAQMAGRAIREQDDGLGFTLPEKDDPSAQGIVSAGCRLVDEGVLVLTVELARVPKGVRVAPDDLFEALGTMGPQARLSGRRDTETGLCSLEVELLIKAVPMSLARSNALLGQLSELDGVARAIQGGLPAPWSDSAVDSLYEPFEKYLAPVRPIHVTADDDTDELSAWALETVDFLMGGSSVAVVTSAPAVGDIALGLVAAASGTHGSTLGRFKAPSISTENVLELNRKAPGTLAIPVQCLAIASSMYELSDAAGSFFAALRSEKPVLFVGSFEQLQGALSGGQGGANDPLAPVVRPVPEIPLELLVRSCVRSTGQELGGLAPDEEAGLVDEVRGALVDHPAQDRLRLLPMVTKRSVSARRAGASGTREAAVDFASRVGRLSTTLGGLEDRPLEGRTEAVAARYTDALTDPVLLAALREQLVGQDEALEQLVARLRTEALTRPAHQPLRWCSQGTPATGKSMSAQLVAQRLGVPFTVIDAASMSSSHAAIAQLLGSSRGIVNSYQAGRLEIAAKNGGGGVVEIADLDHASPEVRSGLSELFLSVLETGTAQSSKGHVFSCAQLVLAFTMNLPSGRDEQLLKGLGFDGAPSRLEVQRRVSDEIKSMLSGAFLSRVGTPVVFQPLDEMALGVVVERAIDSAVRTAAERSGGALADVELQDSVGAHVLRSLDADTVAFGARVLLENARLLAAAAFVDLRASGADIVGRRLIVMPGDRGGLVIETA